MTYGQAFRIGSEQLSKSGADNADNDARNLLLFTIKKSRHELILLENSDINEEIQILYFELIKKRAKRIPLQYITGVAGFMGLEFYVNQNVLIPRQDTETLVEEAMRFVSDGMKILDMCTGSGCAAISLLQYKNDCRVVASDISEKALEVARINLRAIRGKTICDITLNHTEEVKSSDYRGFIEFIRSDLFNDIPLPESLSERFDAIISNPPYIKTSDLSSLQPEIIEHEPKLSLDGGDDGLDFYRRIIPKSIDYLKSGGMLFLEIGYEQAEDITKLMQDCGYREIETVKDLAGLDRVVRGVAPYYTTH